ncbi:hypothetical protein LTR66_016837, partial [Elasticomyces elasticus]
MWIDAICINQESGWDEFSEKTKQIPLMRKIYLQAGRVIVWLGDNKEDGEKALRWINFLAGQEDQPMDAPMEAGQSLGKPGENGQSAGDFIADDQPERESTEEDAFACLKLLQRSWFRRIW